MRQNVLYDCGNFQVYDIKTRPKKNKYFFWTCVRHTCSNRKLLMSEFP